MGWHPDLRLREGCRSVLFTPQVDIKSGRWDIPTVPVVKKLDSKRRAVFPDRFGPGDVFLEEVSDNQITYRLLEPEEVPEGEVIEENGALMIASPLDRSAIARAIRQERDSR